MPTPKGSKPKFRAVGCYGVLQPDGKLWMNEICICQDLDVMRNEVLPQANDENEGKCRIVKLFVRATR